jgi:hypothetical protein
VSGPLRTGPHLRDRLRSQLERSLQLSQAALDSAADASAATAARVALLEAHAARAEDARHGAGQLSLGSQRAPTRADCDDGWRRVASIVAVAEASAAEVERLAQLLDTAAARRPATVAAAAARSARRLVDERNHAYTFHSDPGFSFGEGWYVAAAAVLAGVAIQIEPGKPHTAHAERFLRDAGLGARVQPYRSRPRANKQLTGIVADAFRADPVGARRRIREAFLGEAPIAPEVIDFARSKLAGAPAGSKVLLWLRQGAHHPHRNTEPAELAALVQRALAAGLTPVLVGDALQGPAPPGSVDATLFWKEPPFQGLDMRRAQLQLFAHLQAAHDVAGQMGVTTAGMDGPALLGLPTMYLTQASNVRMRSWVGAIPEYQEVVRGDGHLDHVARELRRWAALHPAGPPVRAGLPRS